MSNFSKPTWDKYILNPDFKYISSTRTDIRDTFRRARMELNSTAPKGQDNNKPLVVNPGAFVLPSELMGELD